jgi:hypothetical protein
MVMVELVLFSDCALPAIKDALLFAPRGRTTASQNYSCKIPQNKLIETPAD